MHTTEEKLKAYLEENVQDLISRTITSDADYELDIDVIHSGCVSANFYTLEEDSQTCKMSIRAKANIKGTLHCSVSEIDSDGIEREYFEQI